MGTPSTPISNQQPPSSLPLFALSYRPGPAWVEGKPIQEQDLSPHRGYIEELFASGVGVLAGPFLDEASGGLAVVRAADANAAREIQARDPAIVGGVFEGEVRPWHVLFDATRDAGEDAAARTRRAGNTQVVRRVLRAARERDLATLLELYSADIEIHDAESIPYGGVYRGHEGVIENARRFVEAWDPVQAPDERDLEERVFASGDRVFALWRARASGKDGARLDSPAISMFELRAGKVVRLQMFHYDTVVIRHFFEQQEDDATAEDR